ncbi:MAG: MFS transporter [Myxococcaceae bacterium]
MDPAGQSAEAPPQAGVQAAGAVPLIGFYVLYFASTGIILPFLPAYFKSAGLSGAQIGILLALQPTFSMFAPPLWGWIADRFGRPDRVLSVIASGAALGFLPLAFARSFPAFLVAMAGYAFFASSITTLLDSMALHRVSLVGGTYARIRMFGSMGFVVSTTAFGLAVAQVDRRAVLVPLALISAYALWSFGIRARSAKVPPQHPLAALGLLRYRDLALMLAASALHWIACAPYHAVFGIHVLAIGLEPWVVGVSAGLGVGAEIAAMYFFPRLAKVMAPRHILVASFAISALRWLGMSLVTSAPALLALSLLHGFSFGAFYIAGVTYVARRVPDAMRASGQALMVSVTYGVGGLIGYLGAGSGYEWLGGFRLFGVAAAVELLPMLLILGVREASVTRTALEAQIARPS